MINDKKNIGIYDIGFIGKGMHGLGAFKRSRYLSLNIFNYN